MTTRTFDELKRKPMLATNSEMTVDKLAKYMPFYVSPKIDGMRILVTPHGVVSRNFKKMPGHLQAHFANICAISNELDVIFDCEMYNAIDPLDPTHHTPFQEIMTWRSRTYNILGRAPEDRPFLQIFDAIPINDWMLEKPQMKFCDRVDLLRTLKMPWNECYAQVVSQTPIKNQTLLQEKYDWAVRYGFEGLMLKNYLSTYKHGRSTVKEGTLFKLKPWTSLEGVISEVNEGSVKTADAVREKDELGRSKPIHRKDERVGSGAVGSVTIKTKFRGEVIEFGASLGKGDPMNVDGLTYNEAANKLLNKIVEVKYLNSVGHAPRHAQILRERKDVAMVDIWRS